MKRKRMLFLTIAILVLAAACSGGSSSSGSGDPVKTVQDYLEAKVKGDKDTIRSLLCSDMEKDLDRETSSFSTVSDAKIQDMTCKLDGDVVRCTGKIVAQYGTEQNEFPLASYKVVQEDGEWKWCGETK